MKQTIVLLISIFLCLQSSAQNLTTEQYIEKFKDVAIAEMKRMGIPADITLAQGILESESGNSELVKKSNNHFGIKCKSNWNGGGVKHDDDAIGECFRVYKDAEESYRDHSNFLRANGRYNSLFKLTVTDYEGWAYGLKKAGYATNPQYPQKLIKLINDYNLHQYTVGNATEAATFSTEGLVDDAPMKLDAAEAEENIDLSNYVVLINGVKCVLVNKGTSILAIAQKQNIPLAKLLAYNEGLEDGLLPADQYIYLQQKPNEGKQAFFTLKEPMNITKVANLSGVALKKLQEYNGVDAQTVLPKGKEIALRKIAPIVQPTNTHKVKSKEGLTSIAKQYNTTIEQLKNWNNLTTDNLRVGQILKIAE
jgi:LysM repeat protein